MCHGHIISDKAMKVRIPHREWKTLRQDNEKLSQLLQRWLDGQSQAGQAVPWVKRALDDTEWDLKSIDTMPGKVAGPPSDLVDTTRKVEEFWRDQLPTPHHYSLSALASGTALTNSAATSTYDFINQPG